MKQQAMWTPSESIIKHSHIYNFINIINEKYQLDIDSYQQLHLWSMENLENFWYEFNEFSAIYWQKKPNKILHLNPNMRKCRWFEGGLLNFSENLLSRKDDHCAIISITESATNKVSYKELHDMVLRVTHCFRKLGIESGDYIAACTTNGIEAVVAMLAATRLGAVWASSSPDIGLSNLLSRFKQIKPKIFIASLQHQYQGKTYIHHKKYQDLANKIPSIKHIISIGENKDKFDQNEISWDDALKYDCDEHDPKAYGFEHPAYVLFTSGTTGKPKAMVHSAIGVLIQHAKELLLHTDLHAEDTIFFYTNCSWMMWHWLISSLLVGSTIVLYDGSPFYPHNTILFDYIDIHNINIAGIGAKITETYQKRQVKVTASHTLHSLRTWLSTGSPLYSSSFEYIHNHIKKNLQISSISGGSDIISCFVLGNPISEVYSGKIQGAGLGMDVAVFNEQGKSVYDEQGELVCGMPFPTMPLYFINDHDNIKYKKAYFSNYKNIWQQHDFAKITSQGIEIFGRSDTTLNRGGIRIGTAEIYNECAKIPQVLESLAVGKKNEFDEEIILFVVLKENLKINENLISEIKKYLRQHLSPHHVPQEIIQVPDIPKTHSGKAMESIVKRIVNHKRLTNTNAVANPKSLKSFKDWAAQHPSRT